MAVVGGGPAGCAAAIVLAGDGRRVVVLERSSYGAARVGETLVPEVGVLLDRLGARDRLGRVAHTPSPGMLAAWGQPDPYANDFVVNPYGPGWRVDRARFDEMLAETAEAAGAVLWRLSAVHNCAREPDGGWVLDVAGAGAGTRRRVSATMLVDAAGRASPLRRRLGVRRIAHDHLVALTAVMTAATGHAVDDRRALIEATEHGWWYSARLPDARLVATFHTDAGPGLRDRWPAQLCAAPHTSARARGTVAAGPVLVAANSQRREPAASGSWLAVGDAAAAHDPIAGLGVYWAIESGIAAAEAILAHDAGDTGAVGAYAEASRVRFGDYLARRAMYYREERRWPEAPFWDRRRPAVAPV